MLKYNEYAQNRTLSRFTNKTGNRSPYYSLQQVIWPLFMIGGRGAEVQPDLTSIGVGLQHEQNDH